MELLGKNSDEINVVIKVSEYIINDMDSQLVEISKMFIQINELEEEMYCGLIGNGIILIKLIIWLIRGIEFKEEVNLNLVWIWKLDLYFKIKIFFW